MLVPSPDPVKTYGVPVPLDWSVSNVVTIGAPVKTVNAVNPTSALDAAPTEYVTTPL